MTQKEALDILKGGHNVYLTGCAGSGKTYLLQQFILSLKFQRVAVGITASTGVASTHLSGMTINSWAGIGVKKNITESDIDDLLQRRYLHRRLKEVKVLIIDEISMLSASTLEAVDTVLRAFKKHDEPFGGIQVVLCGDFFQLPPVSTGNGPEKENSPEFIYKSPLWYELDLKICYLDKPFRQDDKRFLSMLDDIRENNVNKTTWEVLKERFLQPALRDVVPTKLYTHNAHADMVNASELAKITDIPHTFLMKTGGNESLAMLLSKNCLAPERLILKKGAQVMFVKNNHETGYVNGTMGKVLDFDEDGFPIIQTYEGKEVVAYPQEWRIEDPTTGSGLSSEGATIIQIPLRLAWAITIHKSQGMSLDTAEIDLGKSFVEGLGYVALSRVRTLEGIKLRSINRTALSVNEDVIEFDKKLREESEDLVESLRSSYWYKKNSIPS